MKDKFYKLMLDSDIKEVDVLCEQANPSSEKTWWIRGSYIVAGKENANHRKYDIDVMTKAVDEYNKDFIIPCRSLGELNHSQAVEVNPERACHLITELKREDNIWVGKSKVLAGTTCGDLLIGLLRNGFKTGMSTRGVGNLNEKGVVDEFKLISVDAVWNPSGPGCMVEALLESKRYMIDNHGGIVEVAFDNLEKNISKLPRNSELKEQHLIESFKTLLNEIRNEK